MERKSNGYESPQIEIIELEVEGVLCQSTASGNEGIETVKNGVIWE